MKNNNVIKNEMFHVISGWRAIFRQLFVPCCWSTSKTLAWYQQTSAILLTA